MRDVLRTNDQVKLSLTIALLKDAAAEHAVMGANISDLKGMIGIFPRWLMLLDEKCEAACTILLEAEILDFIPVLEN